MDCQPSTAYEAKLKGGSEGNSLTPLPPQGLNDGNQSVEHVTMSLYLAVLYYETDYELVPNFWHCTREH